MTTNNPHSLSPRFQLLHKVETKIGVAYIYKNLVLMEVKHGLVLNYKSGFDVLVNWTKIIGDKPWV